MDLKYNSNRSTIAVLVSILLFLSFKGRSKIRNKILNSSSQKSNFLVHDWQPLLSPFLSLLSSLCLIVQFFLSTIGSRSCPLFCGACPPKSILIVPSKNDIDHISTIAIDRIMIPIATPIAFTENDFGNSIGVV